MDAYELVGLSAVAILAEANILTGPETVKEVGNRMRWRLYRFIDDLHLYPRKDSISQPRHEHYHD